VKILAVIVRVQILANTVGTSFPSRQEQNSEFPFF
jgi:hypothetical protein